MARHHIKMVPESDKEEIWRTNENKYSAVQWTTLAVLAFGNFCLGGNVSVQTPFFPKEAERKGASATDYGLIYGMYQLAVFATAPLMGKLIYYVEPKFLLTSGAFALAVTCVLFGPLEYVNGRFSFVVLAFVISIAEGIGAAAVRIACYALVAVQFPKNMAAIFAILEAFLGVGLIVGPTIGGALYDVGGFGLPFYVMSSLLFVDVCVILLVLPNPERPDSEMKIRMLKFWLYPSTLVYAASMFTVFNYIGFNEATLEPHVRQFNLSSLYVGLLFGVRGICYAITAPCWGWLCDKKYNVQSIAIVGSAMTIVSLLLIGPMSFLNLPKDVTYVVIALVLVGIGTGAKMVSAFSGAMQDTIARGFPDDLTTYSLISSMVASSESLGAFIGPSIGGYLLDNVGYNSGTFILMMTEIAFVIILITYSLVFKPLLFPKRKGIISEKQPLLENALHQISYNKIER